MDGTMTAMIYRQYGPPGNLELRQMDVPAPQEGQVLVRVHAASVNALDWHFLTGKPFLARVMNGGLLKPKQQIPGVDLAGRVKAVGPAVTRFRDRCPKWRSRPTKRSSPGFKRSGWKGACPLTRTTPARIRVSPTRTNQGGHRWRTTRN